jgi:hypothetical protein
LAPCSDKLIVSFSTSNNPFSIAIIYFDTIVDISQNLLLMVCCNPDIMSPSQLHYILLVPLKLSPYTLQMKLIVFGPKCMFFHTIWQLNSLKKGLTKLNLHLLFTLCIFFKKIVFLWFNTVIVRFESDLKRFFFQETSKNFIWLLPILFDGSIRFFATFVLRGRKYNLDLLSDRSHLWYHLI